jgi:two-component system, OmpR family, phosphate regulon sensor histidine kinase PhoR
MSPANLISQRRWVKVFVAVALMVLAQVIWWTTVFIQNVNTVSLLREQNSELSAKLSGKESGPSHQTIERDAFHRRLMFVSESISFVFLTCLGFYLLFHALRTEERTREGQRNFVEIVSHESKTPLTALKLRLESVLEKRPEDLTLKSDLGLCLDEVRRLTSLFEKALNLNRFERQAFQFETLYLADIVQEVTHRLDPLFKSRAVNLRLDLDPDAVVRGDAYGLQNSLQSLLENAVLYNDRPDQKEVQLSVRQRSPRVILEISDNGPGIDPKDSDRIFERFYRGSTGQRVSGTGLGLYLAKTIVEAHQGVLRLVFKEAGTHFEIDLPAASVA